MPPTCCAARALPIPPPTMPSTGLVPPSHEPMSVRLAPFVLRVLPLILAQFFSIFIFGQQHYPSGSRGRLAVSAFSSAFTCGWLGSRLGPYHVLYPSLCRLTCQPTDSLSVVAAPSGLPCVSPVSGFFPIPAMSSFSWVLPAALRTASP